MRFNAEFDDSQDAEMDIPRGSVLLGTPGRHRRVALLNMTGTTLVPAYWLLT